MEVGNAGKGEDAEAEADEEEDEVAEGRAVASGDTAGERLGETNSGVTLYDTLRAEEAEEEGRAFGDWA